MRISDWSSDVCSSDLRPLCGARFITSSSRPVALMGSVIHLASTADAPGESAGEPQTFEAFFTEHRRALSSYLRRRMASEADVQEVVQESYARILSYGYGCSRPPTVWKELLYRIATNLAYSHGRKSEEHTSELQSLMRISYDVF